MFNGDLNVGFVFENYNIGTNQGIVKTTLSLWLNMGWFRTYPQKKLTKNMCNCFLNQFHESLKVVHNLIIVKLHGGTRVWMLKKGIIIIYIEKLTKHKKWLPFCVCLLKWSILSLYQTIMFLKMDIGFLD